MSEAAQKEVKGEVVVIDPQERGIVRAAAGDVVEAFDEYLKIQQSLDARMPGAVMTIQGKQFRKKSYWRSIATAFNLTVQKSSEERIEHGDDWGWLATYTATAKNGRSADGDGSCFASEKRVYLWRNGQRINEIDEEKTALNATVHNVRAHAHTRAANRAISNLVGFGEVSYEEMPNEAQHQSKTPSQSGARTITEKQRKRLFAIGRSAAERLKVPDEQIDEYAKAFMGAMGFQSSTELTREPYDAICAKLESLTLTDLANVPGRESEPPLPDDEGLF